MVYLVRFDSLLDAYVRRVFSGLNGGFSRDSAGRYICGKDVFGSDSFKKGLEKYVIGRLGGNQDVFGADYFFVLGDCDPAGNMLLDFGFSGTERAEFPYRLAENDIVIDIAAFNRQARSVFNRLFTRKVAIPDNVFAVKHSRLGAETLRAFLKAVFGAVNCRNMDGDILAGFPKCVVSENDIIENGAENRSRINSAPETAAILKSIKQYIGGCVGTEWSV